MVCRSVFVRAFPGILSAMRGPGNFPSLTTVATKTLKRAVQDAISCISALLSLENPHSRVRGVTPMKDDHHYSVSYMLSDSLSARISFAHGVKIQEKKRKRALQPSTDCCSAGNCQKPLVFLQAGKTHEKHLHR